MPFSSTSRRWLPFSLLLAGALISMVEKSNASLAAINRISLLGHQQEELQGMRRLDDGDATETDPPTKSPVAEDGNPGNNDNNDDGTKVDPEANSKGDNPTPTPTPDPEQEDACLKAKTDCEACREATDSLSETDKDIYVCFFGIGLKDGDGIICHKEKKEDVKDVMENMCSGPDPPTAAPLAPEPAAGNDYNDDEENAGATAVKAIGGIALLIGIGLFAKSKLSGGGGSAPLSGGKAPKYHEIAVEEEDEDWGWDGNGDNGSGGGDLEMAGHDAMGGGEMPYYKDDTTIKRRTSGDSSPASSPMPSSSHKGNNISSMSMGSGQKVPPAPKSMPAAIPSVSTGSSASEGIYGGSSMSNPPIQRITSLGKKAPPKPKPVKPKKEEDDVFAAFGLAAKPKFAHQTGSATGAPIRTGGVTDSDRWGQPPSTSAFSGPTATVGASSMATPGLMASGSMDAGDDDNWDDGDLDDLLDD